MKKSILAVAGLVAVAGVAAVPMASIQAADADVTDTIKVTIADACTLGYDSTTPHTNGGTVSSSTGTWDGNTLTRALTNSDADTAMGSTKMTISCNDNGGYQVTLTAGALTDSTTTKTIPYITSASAPSSGTSSWGVSTGSTPTWILSGGTVTSGTGAVSGTALTVTYGAATSATQEAGTYIGTAAYTVSHPKTQSPS